jgi:hypothetical protein
MKCQICAGANGKWLDLGEGPMAICTECLSAELKVAANSMMSGFLDDFFAPLKAEFAKLGSDSKSS